MELRIEFKVPNWWKRTIFAEVFVASRPCQPQPPLRAVVAFARLCGNSVQSKRSHRASVKPGRKKPSCCRGDATWESAIPHF